MDFAVVKPVYPRVVVTKLWLSTGITPRLWEELQAVQARADELMGPEHDVFPDRLSDRELLRLAEVLPTPLALGLLKRRLTRGLALRERARSHAA